MGCQKLTYREEKSTLKVVKGIFSNEEKSSAGVYRYGFNGQEKDNEVKGAGNSYTTTWRQYDPRLGIFTTLDPLKIAYPNKSPFSFAGNSPIAFIDKQGAFQLSYEDQKNYPKLTNILIGLSNEVNRGDGGPLLKVFMEVTGATREQALQILTYGTGPVVSITRISGAGLTKSDAIEKRRITLSKSQIFKLERSASGSVLEARGLFWMFNTAWHEGIHFADLLVNGRSTDEDINPKTGQPKGVPDKSGKFDLGLKGSIMLGIPENVARFGGNFLEEFIQNGNFKLAPFGKVSTGSIGTFFKNNQIDENPILDSEIESPSVPNHLENDDTNAA